MINQWISVMCTWAQWGLRDVISNVGLVLALGRKTEPGKVKLREWTPPKGLASWGQLGMLQGSDRF